MTDGTAMNGEVRTLAGVPVLFCAADGPPVRGERDGADLLGDAFGLGAAWVVLPVARLTDDFFRLRTGVAGAIVQKFAQYGVGLVVLGDVSRQVAASEALRDFVRESDRGRQLWFLADAGELAARLAAL